MTFPRTALTLLTLALVAALVGAAAPASSSARTTTARIINGTTVGNERAAQSWPFLVSIGSKGGSTYATHSCGGTVLDAYRILTAAHCFEDTEDSTVYRTIPSTVTITAGIAKLTDTAGAQRRPVADVFLHGVYISDHDGQDLAIIRLAQPLTLGGRVRPVAVVTPEHDAWWGAGAGVAATPERGPWAAGWGNTKSWGTGEFFPNALFDVLLPIVPDAACTPSTPPGLGPIDMRLALCAGELDSDSTGSNGTTGRDTCQGDSGGPLVVGDGAGAWEQAGVVSFGDLCGAKTYGAYTRLAGFRSWVASVPAQGGGPGGINAPRLVHQVRAKATAASVLLAWNAPVGGAFGYSVYVDVGSGAMLRVGTPRARALRVSGLEADGLYRFYVVARDRAGNESPLRRVDAVTR